MQLHRKIIFPLLISTIFLACEKKITNSIDIKNAALNTITNPASNVEKCEAYDSQTKDLCKQRDKKGICLFEKSDAQKALNLLESFPLVENDHYRQYERFFANKNATKKDISDFFSLAATDCWKASELKLWKGLSQYYKNGKSLKDDILRQQKNGILRVQKTPMSIIRLMINIVITKNWANAGLLNASDDRKKELDIIHFELKTKSKDISRRFDSIFQPLIDEQNHKKSTRVFDVKSGYALLEEEMLLIKDYSQKLTAWITKESDY